MLEPFVNVSRAQTMLRDFNRLRRAIRKEFDIEAAEAALDRCERWFDLIDPNPGCPVAGCRHMRAAERGE